MWLPGNTQIFLVATTHDAGAARGPFFAIGPTRIIGRPAFRTHLITTIDVVSGFSLLTRTAIAADDTARAHNDEDCGRNQVL
jgi:hypothetical protein